jgi:hypothetical protein
MSYDRHSVGPYATHLSAVNNSKPVTASENIYDSKGLLLIKKGQPISSQAVERLVSVKLFRPIERSVMIDGAIDVARMLADIQAGLPDADTRRIHEHYQMDAEIVRAGAVLQRFPLVAQKLTVLSMQLPQLYQQIRWGMWLGLIIGRKLGLAERERDEIFLASMMCDFGMLHIDPVTVAKSSQLTAAEQRTLQSHVLIGKLIAQEIEGMPASVVRAVLEHHEIYDGSGYLSGTSAKKLSLLGQILSVIDCMAAGLQRLAAEGRWIRDLLPILQINRYIQHPEVCATLIQILKEYGPPNAPIVGDDAIGEMADSVLHDRQALRDHAEQLRGLAEGLPDLPHRSVTAAQRVAAALDMAIRGSGVLDDGYVGWLSEVASQHQRQHYREVEDTRLMLDEVCHQVAKLTHLLHDMVDNDHLVLPLSKSLTRSIREALAKLEPTRIRRASAA